MLESSTSRIQTDRSTSELPQRYTVLMVHQNLDVINRIIRGGVSPWGAYSLGHLTVMAEEEHVILDEDVLLQIAGSNDLNDATGYFAVWLGKRVEAQGGGKITDF